MDRDSRNFHCWRHRRWVIEKGGDSKENELIFTHQLIRENLSNYSAWHYRSQLPVEIAEELKFVQEAFWTDPHDQSSWIYYRWLILKCDDSQILNEELENIEGLIEIEPDCKYPYFAALWILRKMADQSEQNLNKIQSVKDNLKRLDPVRAVFL